MRSIRQDIQDLTKLAEQRDPACRSALYCRIVDIFEHDETALTEVERQLMGDILRHLTRDVELAIRIGLAERLSMDPVAPYQLIKLLANDDISVARSILLYSKMLSDRDLVEIVRNKTHQHRLSIAARQNITRPVTSALVATGDGHVVHALLKNPTADLSAASYADVVTMAVNDNSLHEPLIHRHDLPADLAERLYLMVSDLLKAEMVTLFPEMADHLDQAVGATIINLKAQDEDRRAQGSPAQRLIDKLYEGGQLTPSFLLKSLNQGQTELFERGFARLMNLTVTVFQQVLYSRGPDGLAVACRAVGIDRSVFLTIYRLSRIARGNSADMTDAEAKHAFSIFQNMDRRKAEITLHRWAADESRASLF